MNPTSPFDLTLKLDPPAARLQPEGEGVALIAQERARQIHVKRRLPQEDRSRCRTGQLAMAGACYALLAGGQSRAQSMPGGAPEVGNMAPLRQWPFAGGAWKPNNNRLKNLMRAGALIAAEIDRLLAEGETLPSEPTTPPLETDAPPTSQP